MTLLLAIIGHLIGDYLIQNDWMALNKKKRSFHCTVHCTLWTCAVCFCSNWWTINVFSFLWITHFAIDRTNFILWYMNKIGQNKFATGPCAPWSIIVVDNVWHIVTIMFAWEALVPRSLRVVYG